MRPQNRWPKLSSFSGLPLTALPAGGAGPEGLFNAKPMNQDLQASLENNAREWEALSLAISSAEKLSFNTAHDNLFATYGSNFMAHVYRTAFEQMLSNTPATERAKLLAAFEAAIGEAVEKHLYTIPTAAQCQACHSR